MEKIKLSLNQIEVMKHAIGLDNSRVKIKRSKYEAYRNYYTASKEISEWEELVSLGLAIKYKAANPNDYICYSVSENGFKLLSQIFSAKITEGN